MNPKETAQKFAGDLLWQASKIVRWEVVDPNGNLEKARRHLQNGALIVYINHFDMLDTTVIGHAVENHLSPLENVAGITGLKHFDPQRNRVEYALIDAGRKSRGFQVLTVVQDYDNYYYLNHRHATSGKTPQTFNLDSTRRALRFLKKPGNIVMLAPEATRSRDGRLLKGHEGIATLLALSEEFAHALPIAMVPPDTLKIVPLFTSVKVAVGAPFSYNEVLLEKARKPDISVTDLMMKRLAVLLPEKYRGFYR
ncbi:MAG: hypothetical protein A2171_02505 [Candidatus Levybacteria bacterium RBG_13_35_9]|nr:MAG: hypothetical protein A2171_02505 [Candidatus Levybacteria bacterium RBG_13_35_9]